MKVLKLSINASICFTALLMIGGTLLPGSVQAADATGGVITTNGHPTYIIHTFTNDGTFTVSGGSVTCDVLVVAGGGGGGRLGGGGGAGGLIYTSAFPVAVGAYTVTIGGGGGGSTNRASKGGNGTNSAFSTIITAIGGGGGGSSGSDGGGLGATGASGGGGGGINTNNGGSGTPPQGNNGGSGIASPQYNGGGGGGFGTIGSNAIPVSYGGNGGMGTNLSISGSYVFYAGGGGGGGILPSTGGLGGGGAGASGNATGTVGTANTGGGGGGARDSDNNGGNGGAGGAGVVIVRYLREFSSDRYVSLNGGNVSPYTNWVDAATNIQTAVDVAVDWDMVWVSNGVYVLTNQVVIDKVITLKSLNGRAATSINGNYPWTTNRCLYVSNPLATIDGFSISNGWASTNVYPGDGYGGGVYLKNGTVINCLLSSNYCTYRGGGIHCNGTSQNTVSNCVLEYNNAGYGGGGICDAGGATPRVSIVNCNISRNIGGPSECGGGIRQYGGSTNLTIRNCVISYNRVVNASGPTYGGAGIILAQTGFVENCTIVGNTLTGSGNAGGGGIFVRYGVAYIKNCIIYSNSSAAGQANWGTNAEGTVFLNNCTDTTNNMVGSGNITANPMVVDWATTNLRLSAARSPCVNTGINQDWMTGAVDFDGHRRILNGTVDMGAYETIYDGTIFQAH